MPPQTPESQSIETILLAEDDSNDAYLACRALQRAAPSYRVVHVPDGEQCINYLAGDPPYNDRSKFPLPVLVLLDLKMPKITGSEVLRWIEERPEFQHLPVVVI